MTDHDQPYVHVLTPTQLSIMFVHRKAWTLLNSYLEVLVLLICIIQILSDMAMTHVMSGFWFVTGYYGKLLCLFSISSYAGYLILLCMLYFILCVQYSFVRGFQQSQKKLYPQYLYNDIMVLRLKKLLCSLSFWCVSMNMVLLVMCFPGIKNPGPCFTVLYANVRGFVAPGKLYDPIPSLCTEKVLSFQAYIFDKNPSLVILNETWLTNEHFDNEIFPNGSYKVFRVDRCFKTHPPKDKGGGVLIAVRSDLVVESKSVGVKCGAEILSIELKIGNNIFCITTCYRVTDLKEHNFIEIERHLRSISKVRKYSRHFFIGDMNLNLTDWPDGATKCKLQNKFVHLFNELGMEQIIEKPTHENGKILDVMFVSSRAYIKDLKILPKNSLCSSDHFAITFSLTTRVRIEVKKRKIFDFKRANWEGMIADLDALDWNTAFNDLTANEAWIVFRDSLYVIANKHIPVITVKNQSKPPWFDCESYRLCKKKEKLHRKWKDSNKMEDYSKFSECRKQFKELVRSKMEGYFEDDVNDDALIKKRFWGYWKSTSKAGRIPESVFYDEKHRNNPQEQATLFNDFFANQFSDPSSYDIPIEPDKDDPQDCESEISFSPSVVLKVLRKVKPAKAAGPDGIHGMILKHCDVGLARPLSMLFRISYDSGIIPKEWKIANVVPVHKKGSKSDVKNYRPISLTCLIVKVFERIVRDKLMEKCKDKLCPNQHGFLPAKSCTTQMIDVNESLSFTINSKTQADMVYFDFAKAFDSVHHDTLLLKLKDKFKINGRLLVFLTNYLKDREQCVVINGCKSEMKPVASGVPQGSILGPLLFVLFINDIVDDVSEGTNIAIYADDTKIWRAVHNWVDHISLQGDIDTLYRWSVNNNMKFHPSKCKVLQCNDKKVSPHDKTVCGRFPIDPYFMDGNVLEYAHSEKDLGVMINIKLNWDEQRSALLRRARSRLGLLKRVAFFSRSKAQKRALYLAITRSQFEHCCSIWRPVAKSAIDQFESVQKSGVKYILNEEGIDYSRNDYLTRLKNLHLLPMEYYFMHNDLILFHKIYKELICVKLPFYFRSYDERDRSRLRETVHQPRCLDRRLSSVDFSTMRTQHLDNQSLICDIPRTSKAYRESFFFRTHILWNHLPLDIRKINCPIKFREALDLYLWELAMKPD